MTSSAFPEQWHPFFVLSEDRTVVHRKGCILSYAGHPWSWSDDKTMDACREMARRCDWLACGYCHPFR